MSEKIKISVVMGDEKPNGIKSEENRDILVLTQETNMTMMSYLLQNRLLKGSFCGGRGDCGRCVIQFLEGAPLPTGMERARLTPEELRQGYRLACVTRPKRDCVIRIADYQDRGTPVVTEMNLPSEIIDLNGHKNNLSVNQKPDAMKCGEEQNTALKKTLKESSVISETNADVMEFAEKNGKTDSIRNECYIIAVDLGTTTIAMQLRNMETGETADTYCERNPQSIYGTDVLARIAASCDGNREELQKLVCEALIRGLRQFAESLQQKQGTEGLKQSEDAAGCRAVQCVDSGEKKTQILGMCIAGNTTMEHLLLGYDAESLGKAPFVPVETGLQKIPVSRLLSVIQEHGEAVPDYLLEESRDFPVYIAPCISAFVGGDVVAGLYALHMLPKLPREENQENGEAETASDAMRQRTRKEKTHARAALLIDLGTNGEMAMTDGRRMIVTATAAGPAFEGRGDVVGTDRIALTADFLRQGIMDETGLMAEPYFEEGVCLEPAGKKAVEEKQGGISVEKAETAGNAKENECYLTQKDIRNIQMAKAAVRAGVEILWEEMGCPYIERVYLAGGFGYYLDVEAAIVIGLLPAYMRGRVQAVGNTSLAGAYELGCALSRGETAGEILEKRLSHIESVNLARKSAFEGLYLKYMNLEEN